MFGASASRDLDHLLGGRADGLPGDDLVHELGVDGARRVSVDAPRSGDAIDNIPERFFRARVINVIIIYMWL